MDQTGNACFDGLSDRSWVVTVLIIVGVLSLLIIAFAIVSCCVPVAKKKIWYPPN